MEIQKSQNQDIVIKVEAFETLAKILWHINQIVAYPLSDRQLEDWSKSILELRPNVDFDAVKFLINKFKTGEREYDYHKGIQNVFIGLRCVMRDEKGNYELLSNPVNHVPRKEGTDNQDILDEIDRRIATGDYVKFPIKPKQ